MVMAFLCVQFRTNEILIIHKTQKSCGTKPVSLAQPSCRYDPARTNHFCLSQLTMTTLAPDWSNNRSNNENLSRTQEEAFNLRLHSGRELKSPLLLWRTGYRFHKHSDLSKQSFLSKWGRIRRWELGRTSEDHRGRREQQCLLLKTNRTFCRSRLTVRGFDWNADLRHDAMTPL